MIKVSGIPQTLKALESIGVDVERAIKNGVFVTAQGVRNTAIKSIQAQSQGRQVTRYSQGGREYAHTASAPGDAPNTDTGALVKSIAVEPQQPELEMFIGSGLEYAPYLEYGTKRMQPRPWLQPALDINKATLTDNITKQIQKAIR